MDLKEFKNQKEVLTNRTQELKNNILELICNVCKERNIGGMFFQGIPQDKTYAVVDDAYNHDGYGYLRVEGFQIAENGRSLYLMTEDDYYNMEENEDENLQETLDYVFLTPEHAEKLTDYFATPIEDTMCPTDTLVELLYTIQEMLQVMEENNFASVSQSIQLKELENTTYKI